MEDSGWKGWMAMRGRQWVEGMDGHAWRQQVERVDDHMWKTESGGIGWPRLR